VARNLITDVSGILVGHAQDARLASGVTVLFFEEAVAAAVDVRGGGPGTRETDLLDPAMRVERIDAVVLSGGSAYGLDAASGVQAWLKEQGRGLPVGTVRVPIVPGAILFDLLNGGDKAWGRYPPYRELAYAAAAAASEDFVLGSAGAGLGATCVDLKGGLGSASAAAGDGALVGALVAANPVGSVIVGDGPWFWAAPLERGAEFGGRGFPEKIPPDAHLPRMKGTAHQSTTLAVIATDASLTAGQLERLAMMAQTGLARAIYPIHTPLDGDIVFAVTTGRGPPRDPIGLAKLGAVAANTLARAVARAVYEATALPFPDALPSWKDRFGT
jgi:L-aminopeptidase/D-esterase-like protein